MTRTRNGSCGFLLLCGLLTACAARAPDTTAQGGVRPPAAPTVVWARDVDHRRALAAPGFSLPAVVGDAIAIGGQDSRAHVLDMKGREQGRFALRAASDSGALALPGGEVVLADSDGMLYALNLGEERESWRVQLSSIVLGRPVLAGSAILVQTGDNRIYAFDLHGEKLWSFSGIAGDITMYAGASPVVSDGVVYAVFTNSDVVALRADSGSLVWRRQLFIGGDAVVLADIKAPVSDPVLTADHVILSFYQGDIIALSRADGERVWARSISVRSAPLLMGGRLYAAGSDGSVSALDPATGETVWKQRVTDAELIGPVEWQSNILLADAGGGLHVMDAAGGPPASMQLAGRIDRAPVVFGGGILLRNTRGTLYLLR